MNTTSIATKSIEWNTEGLQNSDYITATLENENFKVGIRARIAHTVKGRDRRTVIYGEECEKVDFSEAYDYARSLEDGLMRGKNPNLDKMFDTLNAQVKRNKRSTIDSAIKAFPGLESLIGGATLRWSDKAGCGMCKCSPGFLAQPEIIVTVPFQGKYDSEPRTRTLIVTSIWVDKK